MQIALAGCKWRITHVCHLNGAASKCLSGFRLSAGFLTHFYTAHIPAISYTKAKDSFNNFIYYI